ncbi:flippase-like domain-containing protein [Candidatus Woesearchaeota archaeon]|nr:flippase-like domain-containing protein [Candidatus Woesearchaeota archaeon]
MKKLLKIVVPVVVSIALLAYLLSQIDMGSFVQVLKSASIPLAALSFLFYGLCQIIRALRFRLLIGKRIGIVNMIRISFIHNLANNLLPAKAGELSYVYLIKKSGLRFTFSISSLIVARVFDLVALSLLLILSLLFASIPFALPGSVLTAAFLVFILGIALVFMLLFFTKRISPILRRLCPKKFLGHLDDTLQIMESHRGNIPSITSHSVLIWVLHLSSFYFLAASLGAGISFWQAIFISVFYVFLPVLPFHGIAGFGTSEAYWTIMLVLFSMPRESAIALSFALHSLNVLFYVILGVYGFATFPKEIT